MRLSTADLVRFINDLPRDRHYRYVNPKTQSQIEIVHVELPEGPIWIKRFNPAKGEGPNAVEPQSISTEMIARIAMAFRPDTPINFDRVLGGSYNTRSVLEALVAHCPPFYKCSPGRIDSYTGEEKRGHKHIIWKPDFPHELGRTVETDTDLIITEIQLPEIHYQNIAVPEGFNTEERSALDFSGIREHARIQISLVLIGMHLGFNTWVAQNDHSVTYGGRRIDTFDRVVQKLEDVALLSGFESASTSAKFIDCIWFKNGRHIPAIMEIEHSTGVTSGLTRMLGLRTKIPAIQTNYVVVAHERDRSLVVSEIAREQFQDLKASFFPYSAVEELLYLCLNRKLVGIKSEEFVQSFFEAI